MKTNDLHTATDQVTLEDDDQPIDDNSYNFPQLHLPPEPSRFNKVILFCLSVCN